MYRIKKAFHPAELVYTTLLVLFFIITASYAQHEQPDNWSIVKVEGGNISGTVNASGTVHIFKGVPFAAPPLGSLRWKAPQPVKPWTGTRTCAEFSASPMQEEPRPFSMWSEEFLIPKEPISEDCLYLNIWTAARTSSEKRPVLVWIYGGAFLNGGSAVPIYDGEAMARKGIVFVSFNYRVGLFGFFAHPDLTKESGHNASGNYGLMDQLFALQWIQKNIAAFGGDPANVTIAGQSAGSYSVNALVASPLGKGLFQKAIGESGANLTNTNATLANAEAEGIKIAKALNATNLASLRAIPAAELLKQQSNIRLIIDGYTLPEPIVNIYKQGKENKVALLTGWNQEEGFMFGQLKNAADFSREAANYGADSTLFLKYYPATNDSVATASQYRVSSDRLFGTQNYAWANFEIAQGNTVYMYRFTHRPPATGEYTKYGAFHTAEVPYAYGNLRFVNRPWKTADRQLEQIMLSYWSNFAKTGDPNGPGLPKWERYTVPGYSVMMLDEKSFNATMPDREAVDFLYEQMNKEVKK